MDLQNLEFKISQHCKLIDQLTKINTNQLVTMKDKTTQKWEMKGKVYTFDLQAKLVAFTNDIESDLVIIYIGGLGDTLLSTPFTSELSLFCTSKKVRIIIPQLKSMPNYRIFPISSDLEDLHKVIEQNKDKKIILLGHSTGCQVSMLYLKKYGSKSIIQVILQAPVSDVEYEESSNPELEKHLQLARKSEYFVCPSDSQIWLSERFLSLNQRFNTQDLFSSHLPNESYLKWKEYGIPIISIVSGADKYVVNSSVDKLQLGSTVYIIEGASHSLDEEKSREQFLSLLNDRIQS